MYAYAHIHAYSRRTPATVAGACIYLACRLHETDKRTLKGMCMCICVDIVPVFVYAHAKCSFSCSSI